MSGFIKKNMDTFVATAYAIAKNTGNEISFDTINIELVRQFLGNGRRLAIEVAAQHPEFASVAQTIESDTKLMVNSPGEQFPSFLEKELNMIMPFYANADWYYEPNYLSLLLVYSCWGFKDRKSEVKESVLQLFNLIDQQEEMSGGAKLNLIISLWLWDYEDFQNRVLAYGSENTASVGTTGTVQYINKNMDSLVDLAINLAREEKTDYTQESIEGSLMFSWLEKRYGVAQTIAANHPEFMSFVQKIEADDQIITNPASPSEAILALLQNEAFTMIGFRENSELEKDVDFMSLLVAYSCWMLKDDKQNQESNVAPLFALMDNQNELSPAAMLDLIFSLWMWDYDGFQNRVMQKISDTLKQYQEKLQKEQMQRQAYRQKGVCQYCGGTFKGMFSKKCNSCGRPKDY